MKQSSLDKRGLTEYSRFYWIMVLLMCVELQC